MEEESPEDIATLQHPHANQERDSDPEHEHNGNPTNCKDADPSEEGKHPTEEFWRTP